MKRNSVRIVLLLMAMLVLFTTASADVLWEPYGNEYYEKHYEGMAFMDRTYVVPEGMTANLYRSPKTGGCLKTYSAGTRIYIGPYFTLNGEVWAAGYAYQDYETEGWVRLNRLQREYSTTEFMEDYADQITADSSAIFDTAELNGEIPSWTFPGSGIRSRTLIFTGETVGYNEGKLECTVVYTDPNGHRWGFVGYYMGRCGWIYLEDLYETQPPVLTYSQLNSTVTDTSPETDPGSSLLLPILISVVVLIAVTAGAIYTLKKRKKS